MAQGEPSPDTTGTKLRGRGPRLQTFSALGYTNYRYLWVANSFSSIANWVQQVTLALLVANITDDDPFWVATVLGIRALPVLLIGPLAGVAVDCLDRKKLFMFTQLFLVAVTLAFAIAVRLEDDISVYYALLFSLVLGVDMAVNQPVRQSLIANVVPREGLTNALALENSVGNIDSFVERPVRDGPWSARVSGREAPRAVGC